MLQGEVAIITGVGPGMGRATALAFACEGACLALGTRTEERLRAIAKEAEGKNVEATAVPMTAIAGRKARSRGAVW